MDERNVKPASFLFKVSEIWLEMAPLTPRLQPKYSLWPTNEGAAFMWVHKISATQLPVFTSSRTLPSTAASQEGKQWRAAWVNVFLMLQNIRNKKNVRGWQDRPEMLAVSRSCRFCVQNNVHGSSCWSRRKPNWHLDDTVEAVERLFFLIWLLLVPT